MSGPKWYGDTNETPKADPERQKRLDMFACAALTGHISTSNDYTSNHRLAAQEAYKYAAAMEKERARRIKEAK